MKKSLKIIAIFSVAIVYCFAISIYCNTFNAGASFSQLTTSQNQLHTSEVSSNLFCHTTQSESSVITGSHISFLSLKNALNQFSACTHATEKLFFSAFSQYNFYAQNLLIRLKQTDFIYPFHNFW